MKVNGISRNLAHGVVLSKDEFGRLFVKLVGFRSVTLALSAHIMCPAAISSLIRLSGLSCKMLVLTLLFSCQIPKTIILLLGIT